MPLEGRNEKTDVLSNIGFIYSEAVLEDEGELVSDGSEISSFYGRYSRTVARICDITFYYVVDSYEYSPGNIQCAAGLNFAGGIDRI